MSGNPGFVGGSRESGPGFCGDNINVFRVAGGSGSRRWCSCRFRRGFRPVSVHVGRGRSGRFTLSILPSACRRFPDCRAPSATAGAPEHPAGRIDRLPDEGKLLSSEIVIARMGRFQAHPLAGCIAAPMSDRLASLPAAASCKRVRPAHRGTGPSTFPSSRRGGPLTRYTFQDPAA